MLGPDHRTILIQEYADTAALTESNPDQVTVLILPTVMGVEPNMEEMSGAVKDSLRSANVYPYNLQESHTRFNWGLLAVHRRSSYNLCQTPTSEWSPNSL